ncbi:C-type lectin domain family 2 member D isoform 2-T2 [Dama dama]|uniref:C-type lectin domain family 2 member D11-like isoform X2 n=1 Tax=Dama dama TaxID=30532 RepID=UPI002A3655D3|nr:C-type lectin domain family 2 member D11-like isoform X2 [Dama dama]
MAISPGCGPFVRDFDNRGGKDFRKKCLAMISPVTPAKLYCCIVIIFVLIALDVVLFSVWVAVRSREPDSHVLYVTCPKGWIGFGCKCFYFSEDSKSWTFSQTFCTSLGAVLVQFETEEELNFLKRYKDSSDHWIGLSRESSHHPWKWTDNSTYNASFVITGTGECAYLNDVRISSSRVYANRKWICSKTNITQPFLTFCDPMGCRTGEENGNTLHYSCLENPMDRGV